VIKGRGVCEYLRGKGTDVIQHDGNVLAGPQLDGVIKETSGDTFAGLDRSNSQIAKRIEGDNVRAIRPLGGWRLAVTSGTYKGTADLSGRHGLLCTKSITI
jgi:hypothetical protein